MRMPVRSSLIGIVAGLLLLAAVLSIARVPVYAQSQPSPGCVTGFEAPRIAAATSELRAVAFSSPHDGWAVGSYSGPSPVTLYALRWLGRGWSLVSMPNPGTTSRDIRDVAAISAKDAWAVGYYADNNTSYTLTMHWDGRVWRHIPITELGNLGALNGVAAVASDDVWAVGAFYSPDTRSEQSIILHWDGLKWTPAELPAISARDNVLSAISAYSAIDIWAVGTDNGKPLLLHWDGKTWSRIASPEFAGAARLSDVVALGPNGAWAVGGSSDGPLIMRWNGVGWSKMSAPSGSGGFPGSLDSITAISPDDIWAVGNSNAITRGQDNRQLLVVHWTGQTWTTTAPPIAGGNASAGAGVAATSSGEVWIVGSHFDFVRQGRVPFIRQITNPPCAPPSPTLAPTRAVPLEPPAQIPGSNSITFPETGKTVKGLFLDYWQSHGGLAQQGYPISNVMGEVSDLNGRIYTVQYFERAVFEYHPENQPPYNVLLSQLGTFEYKKKYPSGAPNQKRNQDPGTRFFPETGKSLGGAFHHYWLTHGGLLQQGYPISDEFIEVSPLDGKPYTVQYFERAVFEYHPENRGTQYEVLLSHLGRFRLNTRYGPQAPPLTPGPTATAKAVATPRLIASNVSGDVTATDRYIFWIADSKPASLVYGYDLEQNRQFLVSDTPVYKQYIATDGNIIVWKYVPKPNDIGSPSGIMGYDLATRREFIIVDPSSRRWIADSRIALEGGIMYYAGSIGTGVGLIARNLSTREETVIAEGGQDPVIDNGNLVWYQGLGPCGKACIRAWELYLRKKGDTKAILVAKEPGVQTSSIPGNHDISGDNIVWSGPVEERVHLYNISTGNKGIMSVLPAAHPVVSGNLVAWSAIEPSDYHARYWNYGTVKLYDIASGQIWDPYAEGRPRLRPEAFIRQEYVTVTTTTGDVALLSTRR